MAIDTGKIFGDLSIEEYLKNQYNTNKNWVRHSHEYDLVGVHSDKPAIADFAELVPNEAEAVVNYHHHFFGAGSGAPVFLHHQMGIALIPKKRD